uniref:Uncharacterized protein n=1 Tax=Arundo donax TaxID=35708 RepID=A0A0A9G3B3_ARUDO
MKCMHRNKMHLIHVKIVDDTGYNQHSCERTIKLSY